ncbi:hypothetical protein [Intestinibacter sp.]|jgi:hypothetical protein|uniref:hypothetical protein n=1 Tax=Intestinibacter sp. TaxID=1965304 RepID=UPI00307F47D7
MENIIQELLPYAKGFAGFYLIGNVIAGIFGFGFIIYVFRTIIKSHKEFDKEFKNRWRL